MFSGTCPHAYFTRRRRTNSSDMSPKDEIQDSDDDGSDFTPVKDMDARPSLELDELDKSNVPTGQGSNLTDLSFFEQIYKEQEAPSDALLGSAPKTLFQDIIAPDGPGSPVENTPASAAAPANGEVRLVDGSFLMSSVTDPAITGRPAKSRLEKRPPSGLTEVTSPSQPSGNIWEVRKAHQEAIMEGKKAVLPWKKGLQKKTEAQNEAPIQPSGDIWELPVSPEKAPREAIIEGSKVELPWKKKGVQRDAQKTTGNVSRTIRSSPRKDLVATTMAASSVDESHEPGNASPGTKVDLGSSRQFPSSSVVIPQTDEQLKSTRRSLKGKADACSSSFVGDTFPGDAPKSLFVAPSALSSSQKKQYAEVSISSQEQPEPTLSCKADQPVNERGSSASATTIAYPTPTQFKLSRSRRGAAGTTLLSNTGTDGVEGGIMPSSPDIISATERTVKRKKVKSGHETVHLSSEADIPVAGVRERDKVSRDNDHWDSDAIGFHDETYNPRSSRQWSLGTSLPVVAECKESQESLINDRSTVLLEMKTQNENAKDFSLPSPILKDAVATAEVDKSKKDIPKKTRGRKKKEAKSEEMVPRGTGDAEMPDRPEVSPAGQEAREVVAPAKRKRGRAKKSDTSQARSIMAQELAVDEDNTKHLADGPGGNDDDELGVLIPNTADDADSAPPPKKRKGKAKAPPDEPVLADEEPLREMSHNSFASVDAKPDEEKQGAAPTDSKENLRPAAKTVVKDPVKPGGPLQSGKVQYRVGLSKRSRIAPLLKMVRK